MAPFARLPHPARDERCLGKIVAAAFGHRRKTLRNALKGYFTAGDFERLGADGGLRAQDLSIEDFVRLADEILKRENAQKRTD
jgi:16S rRNA (adenine1518-N6/adenine1519-N6)-dimethyltransferase